MSAQPTPLLELPDAAFCEAWREIEPAELDALEAADRARCFARYRELNTHVEASVKNAQREWDRLDHHDPGEPPLVEFPEEWRTQKPGTNALPTYPASDVWNGYEVPKYLVKRILAPNEITVLFGISGHFKSVVAIDLAMSVALGVEYQGLNTRKAGVLYVAGEGHAGIKKRIRAWMLNRGMTAADVQPALHVTKIAADLLAQPEAIKATVEAAQAAMGIPVELVVIDTLAANFGDGDENHANDMQLAVNGAKQAAAGAAVLLVHHQGHGEQERERGSSALKGAADCRLQASYDKGTRTIELSWHKLKDDEEPEAMTFTWRSVPLEWTDDDGEEMTSVVMEKLDLEGQQKPAQRPNTDRLGKNQETAIKTLRVLLAKARKNLKERGEDPSKACILTEGWRAELDRKGIDRKRFHDLLRDLQDREILVIEGPHVGFKPDQETSGIASGSGQQTGREKRPVSSVRLLLRNQPDVKTVPELVVNTPSDADTVPPDSPAALADPLAGLAPGGKGPSNETESKFYPPVPDEHDRLPAVPKPNGAAHDDFDDFS